MKAKNENPKAVRIVILVLAALLLVSLLALGARVTYLVLKNNSASDTVSGNRVITGDGSLVTPTRYGSAGGFSLMRVGGTVLGAKSDVKINGNAPILEFYQGHPDDNQKFEVKNMVPGDSVSKTFCVKAYHNQDVTLFFDIDITEQTKNLGEVLRIRVTDPESGAVICDSFMNDADGLVYVRELPVNADEETIAYYQVDVSLDTSVGNEYQRAMLKADFHWYIEGDDVEKLTPPPKTGDSSNVWIWIVIAGCALVGFCLVLFFTRKKKDDDEEDEDEVDEEDENE